MKKFISLVLTMCMLATMLGSFSVMAATGDGVLDFDTESAPALTVTGAGTADERHNYEEDGYKISGRVSHAAHSWTLKNNELGNGGYSLVGNTKSGVSGTTAQNDPCLMAFVDFTNPAMLTSTDQYYKIEFDFAVTNEEAFEIRATTDNGSTIQLLDGGSGLNKGIDVDALCQNGIYKSYRDTWTNYQIIIKSADVTSTDDGAADSTAENTHQYWIYANGYLINSGTTSLKKYNETNYLNSFAGIKALQLRAYHNAFTTDKETGLRTITKDVTVCIDNFSTSVIDRLPATDWEASMDFDSLTDSTDLTAINSELWAEQLGYFTSGAAGNYTWIRSTTKGLGSIEGGVYGKDADDKAISVSLDGSQTDGTHFFQIHETGQGMNQMQRMSKGDFYEFQTYMAWEDDAKLPGVQGFYSNTASNDGKGQMLLSVSPESGGVAVLGVNVPGVKVTSRTWYKFNIVVHSGDVNATDNADKNWYNLYINDKLVAQKVVFTPSIRSGTQATFLGVDQYWFQVGAGAASTNPEQISGKVYYDDIKIKYSTSEATYSPVTVSTTDEIAASYLGSEGHVPGFGSYVDEGASYDADKWSVSEGTISMIPSTDGINNYAKIVKADGTKIFANFKKETTAVETKTFAANSNASSLFNYAVKDFTTYTFGSGIAGRSADDYSFKMDSVGVYDNWVMTKDENGNATTAAYQKDPANWINKSDIPADTTATYAFRDSYNPFVQIYPADHFPALNYNTPWSLNLSLLADGDYNTVDIQVISNDNGGRVTKNIIALNNSNGNIYVDGTDTNVAYGENQWLNFVVNVYPATKKIAVWYDGECIYDGAFGFPWERLARIKFQHAIGSDGYHSSEARTCKLYADDIIFYQGSRFVPTAIEAEADSDKFDSSSIADNVVVANADTTAEDILAGISGNVALYADKGFTPVTTGAAAKGNIAVITSADGLVYKYIYVANSDQDASADVAYSQSYQPGFNSFGTKYYTDNIIDGVLIAVAYKTVDGVQQLESCNFVPTTDASYVYNGTSLVMTPQTRVNITTTEDTTGVKIFLWDSVEGLKPVAADVDCTLKAAEAE